MIFIDNLNEMSNIVFCEKKNNIFQIVSPFVYIQQILSDVLVQS